MEIWEVEFDRAYFLVFVAKCQNEGAFQTSYGEVTPIPSLALRVNVGEAVHCVASASVEWAAGDAPVVRQRW
jgi:hypothetical protein